MAETLAMLTPHHRAALVLRYVDGLPVPDVAALLDTPDIPDTRTRTEPPMAGSLMPYLTVRDAAAAIDFYVAVFGAVEDHRLLDGDRIGHAELVIGDSRIALADEYPEYGVVGPTTLGGTPVTLHVTVPDVDATHASALAHGATDVRPPSDQFHGNRNGQFLDPWGQRWIVSTHIHDRYREEATAAGFQYVPGTAVATDGGSHDHQVKHHERGDLYYFTLPTQDLARAKAFFGEVLGWQFDDAESGHASNISAPPGGLHLGNTEAELWFTVPDIHVAVARVRELGGTSTEPVFYDSGWAAECTDDQGTRFSLSVPAAKYTR
ncbi:MAG: VOC family protein [Ilumatobacteraceae bacterium]